MSPKCVVIQCERCERDFLSCGETMCGDCANSEPPRKKDRMKPEEERRKRLKRKAENRAKRKRKITNSTVND